MDFRKEQFMTSIAQLAGHIQQSRPNSSMSVITIPQFTKECQEANDTLIARQDDLGLDVIDLRQTHRAMLNTGKYTYNGAENIDQACAKSIARRAANFLGVKLNKIAVSRQTQEPPRPVARDPSRTRQQPMQPTRRAQQLTGSKRPPQHRTQPRMEPLRRSWKQEFAPARVHSRPATPGINDLVQAVMSTLQKYGRPPRNRENRGHFRGRAPPMSNWRH